MNKESQAHVSVGSKQNRMTSVQTLKQFVNDRLAAAAEEIFGVFQQTVSELENELNRQRELLDVFRNQPVILPKTLDIQLPQVTQQEDFSEQECSLNLDLEEPEPSFKEDEKQVDVVLVQVKSEDEDQREEESSTSNLIQHIKTEADKDDLGGRELHTLQHSDQQMSLSCESDTDDSEDWSEIGNTQPCSKTEENLKINLSKKKEDADTSLICPVCGKKCPSKIGHIQHLKSCYGLFTCSTCGECFEKKQTLQIHMKIHAYDKPFSCPSCGNSFTTRWNLKEHMRIHTGEKPFSCSVCRKDFRNKSNLHTHMKSHNM